MWLLVRMPTAVGCRCPLRDSNLSFWPSSGLDVSICFFFFFDSILEVNAVSHIGFYSATGWVEKRVLSRPSLEISNHYVAACEKKSAYLYYLFYSYLYYLFYVVL